MNMCSLPNQHNLPARAGRQTRENFKKRSSLPAPPPLSGIVGEQIHQSFGEFSVMVISSMPHLQEELERQVSLRTGHRVRNLIVELESERIILRGKTTTYHVKQLAQHGVLDMLPHARLENGIVVEV
jgi:hypothetical protein